MSECNYFRSCVLCGSKVKNVETHLSEAHEIDVEVSLLNFKNLQEFHKWKEYIEKETVSRYVKQYGAKKRKDGRVVTYYHCHRDGNYVPKGSNKRSLKKSGSNKINGICPSLIKAEQDSESLRVRFVATHVGHTCDIGRLVLTTSGKEQIKAKTNLKVSVTDIIGEINSGAGMKLKKIHLAEKQDIQNIVHYNLQDIYNSSVGEVSHCIKDAETHCKTTSQSLCGAKELIIEEVGDLEINKRSLVEHIGKIILNIESVAEFLAVQKYLKPLEKLVQNSKNSRSNVQYYLSSAESAVEPPNKRIYLKQNLKLLSNQEHDHLYQSLKEPPSLSKRSLIREAKDSTRTAV